MKEKHVLCFDCGASSGRATVGSFDGGALRLTEIYRFNNQAIMDGKDLCWDAAAIYNHIKSGIAKAASQFCIESLAIDTWGVDFGLIGADGQLLSNPFHYRHPHTQNMVEEIDKLLGNFNLFKQTGNAMQPYNTFLQLMAMTRDNNPALRNAKKLLFMPDLFNYFLTGEARTEKTIASTSQLTLPRVQSWNYKLIGKAGIDAQLFADIIPAGSKIGGLSQTVADEINLTQKIAVYSTASHDTAAAVAAIPADCNDFIYLSSGTWSLLGTIIDKPALSESVFKSGYTNEYAADGRIRMLKSIMGLWIIQECKRDWEAQGYSIGFSEIAELAGTAPPFKCFINPDDPVFYSPGKMTARINDYCKSTGQLAPQGVGQTARCIFESLAFAYRSSVEKLESITGKEYTKLYVIGGGSGNRLLNDFTASAIKKPVIAGIPEATSAGNILCQLAGLKLISSLEEGRRLVRNSFECTTYIPRDTALWDQNYKYYQSLLKR